MNIKTAAVAYPPQADEPQSAADGQTLAAEEVQALALAVQRAAEGLSRWQVFSFEQVCDVPLTGAEITLLLLIGEDGTPKAIKQLAAATNRIDIPNIQYSLRKLAAAGLTCKQGAGRSGVTYLLTGEGRAVLEQLLELRAGLVQKIEDAHAGLAASLRSTREALDALTGVYGAALGAAGLPEG